MSIEEKVFLFKPLDKVFLYFRCILSLITDLINYIYLCSHKILYSFMISLFIFFSAFLTKFINLHSYPFLFHIIIVFLLVFSRQSSHFKSKSFSLSRNFSSEDNLSMLSIDRISIFRFSPLISFKWA